MNIFFILSNVFFAILMEYGGKIIIQMMLKLGIIVLIVLYADPVLGQFGTTLSPINRCLGNCGTCPNDELSKCSSCVQGFKGSKCQLAPQYIKQQVLSDPFSIENSSPYTWDNTSITRCSYQNSQGNTVTLNVLGLYSSLSENAITIDVLNHYENVIVYFNMIRSSWAPFSDLLRVGFEADSTIIGEYFIEYQRRDQINTATNKVSCGGLPRINDKFQIIMEIPNNKRPKKLRIHFEGMVFSGAVWGLTNVKVIFGCDNFLTYNKTQKTCSICTQGFYKTQVDGGLNCERCPSVCHQCTDSNTCQSCMHDFELVNGTCKSIKNKTLEYLQVSGSNNRCGFFISKFNGDKTILSSQVKGIKAHEPEISLFADIAHIPQQWTAQQQIQVWINGVNEVNISTLDFSDPLEPKKHCPQFDSLYGYYSIGQIRIDNYQSTTDSIQIQLRSERNVTLGISHVAIQYQPQIEKPKPTENVTNDNQSTEEVDDKQETTGNDTVTLNQTQNTNQSVIDDEGNQTNQEFMLSDREMYIKELKDNKERIVFQVQTAQQLIVRMVHPFIIEDTDNFPFVAFAIDSKQFPSAIIDSGKDYQLFRISVQQSLINQKIKVIVRNKRSSPDDSIILVQQTQSPQKQQNGFMQEQIGEIHVKRYDKVSDFEWGTIKNCEVFFQIIAWSTIILTIILSCLGNSVIVQQFSLLLQILFLHVYIYTQYLPVTFKYTIAGLTRMQNLNYFTEADQNKIQDFLLPGILQNSPLKFITMGHKDINFTRSVYPIFIITIGYFVWFVVMNVIRKKIEPDLQISEEEQQRTIKERISLLIIRTSERVLNFWNQVWQYQFITVVWAACIQFYNFQYPDGKTHLQVPNFIFCFVWLIFIILLPPLTMVYLNKKYFRLDYFQYCYWYQNLFFLQLPDQSLPSNHHRVLIVVRNVRYLLIVICFAALASRPLIALIFLCIVNAASWIYYHVTHVEIDKFLSKINFFQHLLFIILAILIMICYGVSSYARASSYLSLGKFMLAVAFLLVISGILRVFYMGVNKFKRKDQKSQMSEFKPAIATERVV